MQLKVCWSYSRNLGRRSILARNCIFLRKELKTFNPPIQSVLTFLHQNKALHSFCKRVKCSIVECNIGLEYALVCLLKFSLNFYSPKYLY